MSNFVMIGRNGVPELNRADLLKDLAEIVDRMPVREKKDILNTLETLENEDVYYDILDEVFDNVDELREFVVFCIEDLLDEIENKLRGKFSTDEEDLVIIEFSDAISNTLFAIISLEEQLRGDYFYQIKYLIEGLVFSKL